MATPEDKPDSDPDEHWPNIDNKNLHNQHDESNCSASMQTDLTLALRQDSTETYLADNPETFDIQPITHNQPGAEMSQAARISNFLENFARNSSESADSSLTSPAVESSEKGSIPSSPTSPDFIDAITLVVPQRAPRIAALSREGSVRSSFEIYKINEESGEEEVDHDSPRSGNKKKNAGK